MKYSLVALALAAAVHAQTRADIPKCALPCLDDSITANSDCKTTDYTCVCKNFDAIRGAATSCVIDKCGADVALNKVLPATEALCKNQGSGSADTTSAAETTSAAAETTSAAAETTSAAAETTSAAEETTTAAEETTTAAEETTTAVVETTTAAIITTVTSAAGGCGSNATATGTGGGAASTSAVVTGGAATLGSIGAAAMAFLGFLAL